MRCHECGRNNNVDNIVCSSCGVRLEALDVATDIEEEQCQLVLVGVSCHKARQAIVRELIVMFNFTLQQANRLIEDLPSVLIKNESFIKLVDYKKKIEEIGGIAIVHKNSNDSAQSVTKIDENIYQFLSSEIKKANRTKNKVGLFILDIMPPLRKQIDPAAVKNISDAVSRLMRKSDTLYKIGQNRFIIIAFGVNYNGAMVFETKILRKISSSLKFSARLEAGVKIGWAIYPGDADGVIGLFDVAENQMEYIDSSQLLTFDPEVYVNGRSLDTIVTTEAMRNLFAKTPIPRTFEEFLQTGSFTIFSLLEDLDPRLIIAAGAKLQPGFFENLQNSMSLNAGIIHEHIEETDGSINLANFSPDIAIKRVESILGRLYVNDLISLCHETFMKISRHIGKIEDILTLPSMLNHLMCMMSSKEKNLDDLYNVISADPGLSLRALRFVNSEFFGSSGNKIFSIREAVDSLGREKMFDLAFGFSGPHTKQDNNVFFNSIMATLWQHSLKVAVASRQISRTFNYPNLDEAYSAGLMHDLGKIVLFQLLPTQYKDVYDQSKDSLFSNIMEIEEEHLGMTHVFAGGHLAELWNLPIPLINSIIHHHRPHRANKFKLLVSIVHLADVIANAKKDIQLSSINYGAWKILKEEHPGLSIKQVEDFKISMDKEMATYIEVSKLWDE